MAFIPWDVREPGQREFPEEFPYAEAINAATAIVCPLATQLNQFQRQILDTAFPGAAVFTLLTGENVINRVCNGPPVQAQLPLPTLPRWSQGCRSSGRIAGRVNVGFVNNPVWVDYEETWNCTSNNVGLPISGPRFVNVGGSQWAWVVDTDRGDGTPIVPFEISAPTGTNNPQTVLMQVVEFNPCPGCNAPPPTVTPPGIPPRDPTLPPVTRPRFDIDFPVNVSPPGLPDLTVKVPYEIVFGVELNVQFPGFVLQPRVDISPQFGIYPTFEFNAGGVSISTGGVNIPINNEFNLINNASGGLTCEQLRECIEDLLDDEGECTSYTTTVIGSGTTTIQNSVREYAFALNAYDFITLEITGTLPDGLSYVQTNKATGFWGGLAATYQGAHYENTMVYSRQAATSCKGRPSDGVRLYLKPGLNFTLRGHKCNE